MSTPNFSMPKLNRHYCIGMSDTDDEFLAQVYYDDEMALVLEELDKIKDFYQVDKRWYRHPDRYAIGQIDIPVYDREYKEWQELEIEILVEPGYYQGAMFDIQYNEDLPLTKTNQKKIQNYINKIEAALDQYTTKLNRVAIFSNGEAIYQEAK